MFTSRLILALACVGAVGVGAAFAGALRFSPALQEIPMGETEMKGGTTKIGEISPGVISADGATSASGSVCNKLKVKVTDLDFEVKKGNTANTKLELKGSTISFTNGTAHFDYPPGSGLEGNQCEDYKITGLKADGSGANLVIQVTPSTSATLAGGLVHCNILPEYNFDVMSDMARNGMARVFHGCVLAVVNNADRDSAIVSLSGTVTPLQTSQSLISAHLLDMRGLAVNGATTSLSGAEFTISGFTPLAPEKSFIVALRFSGPLAGAGLRAQLQASFDQ